MTKQLIYNSGIKLYVFFIWLASLFNEKARLFLTGRKNVFEKLIDFRQQFAGPVVWFHAASLGEFEQGLPVMAAYRKKFPRHKILITFFSPSGYEQCKHHPLPDLVSYLPVDTKNNARKFIAIIAPLSAFFIKYEYWFHYLHELHLRKIPLYGISALFTPEHIFFKPYGSFHRKMLRLFDFIFVQNEPSLKLLQGIGIQNAVISGDTRFDRVLKTTANPTEYQGISDFKGNVQLCIIGSAWPDDMYVLNEFINHADKGLKFIIAPHLVDKAHIKKITSGLNRRWHCYSINKNVPGNIDILILDTVGMLSSVYQYGDFAYIGGAFGNGLHNILEAVAFSLPVVYGNSKLEKFPEAVELQQLGGGFSVNHQKDTADILQKLHKDDAFRVAASCVCRTYVQSNAGATDKILGQLWDHE